MRLIITVEGKKFEVDVEVAEPEPVRGIRYVGGGGGGATAGARAAPKPEALARGNGDGRQPADEAKTCRSPLTGVVSQVNVAVGDDVAADQPVLVLEAMKMLTTITSPVAGKVKALDVAVGDAVKQGQLLVELE